MYLKNKFSSIQDEVVLQINENIENIENIDTTSNNNVVGDSLLIDLIRGYPHLYDKSSPNYKDSLMKENSWKEIAEIMLWTRKYKFCNYMNLSTFLMLRIFYYNNMFITTRFFTL